MGDRSSKLNGAHAVTTDFCPRDFDAALVADHTFIADAFVLTAVAFPVLGRAKDAFAEKAVPFWFQRSIVIVSGFVTSPWDQERIFSGEARPILIE